MANFCTQCGTSVAGSENFCPKCGAAIGHAGPASSAPIAPSAPIEPPAIPFGAAPPSAAAPFAPAPAPTPTYRIAPPPKKDNRVLAIVLIIVGFFVVMGIAGIVGVVYVSHRVKQRFHEIQEQSRPTEAESAASARARRVTDVCALLPDADVSQAIGIPIVRSLSRNTKTCTYYAEGVASDFLAKKMAQQHQTDMTPEQQKKMQSIISGFSKNLGSDESASPNGQTPVLVVTLAPRGGKFQMGLMKPIFNSMGAIGQMNEIHGLGDEAISASDSLLVVRKGDAVITFAYNYLVDGTPKAEILAREVLGQL